MTPDIDEIEVFFSKDDGGCFIESLIRSRAILYKTGHLNGPMINELSEVIMLEIELAKMGAQKAKSEIIKKQAKDKDNLRPIK